jgi:hypothetical protein
MTRKINIVVHNYYEEITTNGFLFHNSNTTIGHNLLAQWVDFYRKATKRGYELFTLDQVENTEDIDVLICLDRPSSKNLKINSVLANPRVIKYLITYENPMIYPGNWESDFHNRFNRVYTWNDDLVDNIKYFKINYATQTKGKMSLVVTKKEFVNRKLCGMISGAKYLDHPNSIYQLRIDIINWFQKNSENEFDLWGQGWGKFNLPCYRGESSNKMITGNGYKFLFALENAKNFSGYISEKIFDAFVSGSVPIYSGAPNVVSHIPKNTFISFDDFDSMDHLLVYLKSISYESYCEYLKNIDVFLNSDKFDQFTLENLSNYALEHISADSSDRLAATEFSDLRIESQIKKNVNISVRNTWKPRDLIIAIPYGFEMQLFQKARSVWESFRNIYSDLEIIFFRDSNDLPLGEISFDRGDLVVGTKCEYTTGDYSIPTYAQTGSWSPAENFSCIFRQITLYHHLLRTRKNPFYVYHSTVTSVVDFRGLSEAIAKYNFDGLLAGMPGRLANPQFNGLTFVCGTNNLVSSDIVKLMADRFKFGDQSTFFPNDIWQAIELKDVRRKVLPFFTVGTPVDFSNFDEVLFRRKIQKALELGHYHFRVKTLEPRLLPKEAIEIKNYKRENVDPKLMKIIMEEIGKFNFKDGAVTSLLAQLSMLTNASHSLEFDPFEGGMFMRHKVGVPFNDEEVTQYVSDRFS